MKDKVSVDKEEYEVLKKIYSQWMELQKRQSKSQASTIIKSEWERLRRLEENVKELTLALKEGLPNLIDKNNEEIVKQIIKSLESLYK